MKIRKIALLALTGIILSIFRVVMGFFIPVNKTSLMSNSIGIIGNALLVIFFYLIIVEKQATPPLRTAGVLGLGGCLIITILSILGMIYDSIFNIAVKDLLKYGGLVNIVYISGRVNFFIGLIPTILIIACFIVLYRNLTKKVI